MMDMSLVNVFYSKVVHYEAESDGSPLVVPDARGVKCVIVSRSVEACSEYIIGKTSILGEAIDTFHRFKIDPPVLCERL